VKFVVASAVEEEGDQLHPRVWNYEFIQLPLVIKEMQSRPTVTEAEVSGLLNSLKERYAVLVALLAGTGLRIGEALAVRSEDLDPDHRVLHVRRRVWHRREQKLLTRFEFLRGYTERKGWLPFHDASRTGS
jgi:integrase